MTKAKNIIFLVLLILVLLSTLIYAGSDEILNTYPEGGAKYVPLDSKIKIFFDGERDKINYSFSSTPSVEGTVSLYENAIIFTPSNSLKKSTEYKVTIKNKKDGSSYNWSFTTNSTSLPPAKGPKDEKLAGIGLRDSVYTVLDLLGEPDEKTEPRNCPATCEVLQHYIYTTKGINISIDTAGGAGSVSFITITSPCKEGTLRGIKIGDPEGKVRANYIINEKAGRGGRGMQGGIICGYGYPGIEFVFDENGRVKKISMGQVLPE